MSHSHSVETPQSVDPSGASPGDIARETVRYWESRRVGYNLVLAAVVVAWLVATWPHFRSAFSWPHGLALLVLAAIANVCYCAAYPLDLALQGTRWGNAWQRRRWILWCAGVLFAMVLACYWIADEIYPAVN